MKKEIVAKRIAEKTNCPNLFYIIMGEYNKSALPEECLLWKGKVRKWKPVIKMQRDWSKVPFMAPSIQLPRAVMRYRKRDVYVHRFLIEMIENPNGPFVTTTLCGTPYCVNPKHWVVSPAPGCIFMPDSEHDEVTKDLSDTDGERQENAIEFEEELWPEDEVEHMIDRFLCVASGRLDPSHNLLVDIPFAQLRSVAEKMGFGHHFVEV